ncbi:MAG TPA: NAD(P)H-dependent oxidoreductase subunit E [Nitrospirae bacterium]|nr:NADP-reducing hydrogenase subunit HndA [bacterium BMS3Bbin08]HDH05326.1 NAD(P)H-dependent oxidoreductase subunit E [Nitrospirota bacterium]
MNPEIDEVIGHIGDVLTDAQKKRGVLIHAFQQIQKEQNYLPEEELIRLSKKLDIPLSDVYSTATFYKQFYFSPRGKKIVRVCTGTACHVRGADKVLDKIKEEFTIDEGETTEDLSMTLETVGCIGCCGLAPVATINESIVGEIDMKKLDLIVDSLMKDEEITGSADEE